MVLSFAWGLGNYRRHLGAESCCHIPWIFTTCTAIDTTIACHTVQQCACARDAVLFRCVGMRWLFTAYGILHKNALFNLFSLDCNAMCSLCLYNCRRGQHCLLAQHLR
jgi:hypothetical protein